MSDLNLRKPYLSLPGAGDIPNVKEFLASKPKEQEHKFESAGEFVKRLAQRISRWREMLPNDLEPVILTFLPTGDIVEVLSVGEDGHSSVVIEGLLEKDPVMFISHQASLQVLCYTRKVEDEEDEPKKPKRRIGFHVGGEEIEA